MFSLSNKSLNQFTINISKHSLQRLFLRFDGFISLIYLFSVVELVVVGLDLFFSFFELDFEFVAFAEVLDLVGGGLFGVVEHYGESDDVEFLLHNSNVVEELLFEE